MPLDIEKIRIDWKSSEKYDILPFFVTTRFLRHER